LYETIVLSQGEIFDFFGSGDKMPGAARFKIVPGAAPPYYLLKGVHGCRSGYRR
jgi:hypothetical protein